MPTQLSPVNRILNLLKLERKEITAVYFYAILSGLIQLSLPLGIQAIIGFVLGASMRASLVILIVLVVLGVFAVGMMQVNQMKIIEKIQQKIFVRYALNFSEHIPKLELKQVDHIYLPELINRFFDVPVLQKSISKILLDIPTATIQIIFGLLLLSFYHPVFIIFSFFLIFLLWVIIRYTGNRAIDTSIQESNYKYKVVSWLQETARVIKSIKLAKSNSFHLQKTDKQVSNYLDARTRHFKILLFQFNVLVVFKTLITAAMLIVGTTLLVNQQLNIGQFIAAEIIILLVLNSVEKLITNLASVYDTLTSVEKIANLTDKPIEENGSVMLPEGSTGLKVELRNLSFSYDNEVDVLTNINLLIQPNEKICIQGKDSAGKSTLLRLLAGAYTDFEGSLLINDVPVGNYNLQSLRSQIGVLMNQQDIFHGSVWENISLGNEHITMQSVIELAEKTGLNDFVTSLKKGYDTILDPTGKKLPRNIVQKILMVRALAGKPRLLLLEEPTLQTETEYHQQIINLIGEIEGTTLVIVSNDEVFAKICNQVVTMKAGKVVS